MNKEINSNNFPKYIPTKKHEGIPHASLSQLRTGIHKIKPIIFSEFKSSADTVV